MNRGLGQVLLAAAVALSGVSLGASEAEAFCGFFVSDVKQPLYNSATQVVMMRDGTQTVLSMRNNYQGPTEDFAMVVPVPQVLSEESVKTLDDAIFARMNKFSAPRMVEYHERNPCGSRRRRGFGMQKGKVMESAMAPTSADASGAEEPVVKIEAQFEVGEYEILILSAKESNGLEKWLLANKYNIPSGAAKVLAPYIAQGMYFFVAKVNSDKVKFDDKGNAMLSPLRFHYDTEEFSLPIRLGLLNADGAQDLIVHILSREGRYKVANYKNVAIPTNLIIDKKVRPDFATFYDQLFQATVDANPKSVITEFAWGGTPGPQHSPPVKCDPCVEPPYQTWESEIWSLGAELLSTAPSDMTNLRQAIIKTELTVGEVTAEVDVPPTAPIPAETMTPDGADAPEEDETTAENDESAPTPTAEGGPVPTPMFDTRQVRDLFERYNAQLEQCHVQFVRDNGVATPFDYEMVFTIDSTGKILSIADNKNDSALAQQAIQYYARCVFSGGDRLVGPRVGTAKVTVPMSFATSARDGALFDIRNWTVTRLHARYTAEEVDEDLIFEMAPAIVGGRGTPRGVNPVMDTEPRTSQLNNFQARYMILYPYEEFHFCWRPERGIWTGGQSSGTSRQIESSLKAGEQFNLREVIRSDIPLVSGRARE